jgi:hypothetical protein
VLGVICVSEATKENPAVFQAWVQLLDVRKGELPVGSTTTIQWVEDDPRRAGTPYYPGEEVVTYLGWDEQARTYETLHDNAKQPPTKKAKTEKLVAKAGKVMLP